MNQLPPAGPADAAAWLPDGVGPIALLRVEAEATLMHEGAPARFAYRVQAGHFKTVRVCEDGYEQVLDFIGSGELLGCDALTGGQHASGAVALETAWVVPLPLADVRHWCYDHADFALRWQTALAAQIARAGDLGWVMGAVGADKRVARFVLLLARRQAERGESARRLRLPMRRRDVASHLGLAHESVSRSFSLLASAGLLRVDNREVEVLDAPALRSFASCTRGYADAQRHARQQACA